MHAGISLQVEGLLWASDHRWWVSVFLYKNDAGQWRTDSPYRLHASILARFGPHRTPSLTARKDLLKQVYEFVDEQYSTGGDRPEFELKGGTATNNPKGDKHMESMNAARCAIYTKYGKGPQCPKLAAIGSDICSTHKYLETKLGTLPRQPVMPAPVEPVVLAPVEVAPVIEPALMAARMAPDTVAAGFTEPVQESVVPVEAGAETKKIRKSRKDKGTHRKRS
jgi:hypothetical protein